MVQYTITGYPRVIECGVVDASRSVGHMKELASTYGPRAAVWRYDTILFTSMTTADFHRRNFEVLAKSLQGTTDEVIVSFAQFYKKTRHNLDLAARKFGFSWEDPSDEFKLHLATELSEIASSYGMRLSMCGQRQFLAPGVADARCIDAERLAGIAGRPVAAKEKGHRSECGCFASVDIGEYDTCPHGCVYCYAVRNRGLALSRYKEHDPASEFLFAPRNWDPGEVRYEEEESDLQGRLF